MKKIHIDVLAVDQDDVAAKLLYAVLISESLHQFSSHRKYAVKFEGEVVEVSISNTLIKNIKTKKSQRSFYIKGCSVGDTGASLVSSLHGRLMLDDEKQSVHLALKTKYLEKNTECFDPHLEETSESVMLKFLGLGGVNVYSHERNKRFSFFVKRALGENLQELLQKAGDQLTLEQRLSLSIAILEAYETQIYQKGILHCDVKPENIMVNWDGELDFKVEFIDFQYALKKNEFRNALHRAIRGTILYMDPDLLSQVHRSAEFICYSEESDLWSLNFVLFDVWQVHNDLAFMKPLGVGFLTNVVLLNRLAQLVRQGKYHENIQNKHLPKQVSELLAAPLALALKKRPLFLDWKKQWHAVTIDSQADYVTVSVDKATVVKSVQPPRQYAINIKSFKGVLIGAAIILSLVVVAAAVLTALYFTGFAALALAILAGIKTALTIGGFGLGGVLSTTAVFSVLGRAKTHVNAVIEAPKKVSVPLQKSQSLPERSTLIQSASAPRLRLFDRFVTKQQTRHRDQEIVNKFN